MRSILSANKIICTDEIQHDTDSSIMDIVYSIEMENNGQSQQQSSIEANKQFLQETKITPGLNNSTSVSNNGEQQNCSSDSENNMSDVFTTNCNVFDKKSLNITGLNVL